MVFIFQSANRMNFIVWCTKKNPNLAFLGQAYFSNETLCSLDITGFALLNFVRDFCIYNNEGGNTCFHFPMFWSWHFPSPRALQDKEQIAQDVNCFSQQGLGLCQYCHLMAVSNVQDLIYEYFIHYNSTINRHLSGFANKYSLQIHKFSLFQFQRG